MNKKILVTGGCGFIGSNFINLLLKERPTWEVYCIDALTYAANINTLKNAFTYKNFKFHTADIRDRKEIFRLFKEEHFDMVVNFAAESHVDNSIFNPSVFIETNVNGIQNLLDASKEYNVKRFHQVSTDEVYGDLPLDKPNLLFTEESQLKPSSPYSASKAAADLLCSAYYRTYNLPITISRCSNNYGPYQFPEKLIPLMFLKASNNESLPIYGDGLNVRDWLYVEDHCRGILSILENGVAGEIYNLGGNNELANIEIVKIILKELNKPDSLITYVEDRKGHDRRYAINPNKAMTLLNWKPETQFNIGIKNTLNWYKNNLDWLNECLLNK